MATVAPDLRPDTNAAVPSFGELKLVDAGFFRRGQTATHRDEFPPDLHDLFWSRPENQAAMKVLGEARPDLQGRIRRP